MTTSSEASYPTNFPPHHQPRVWLLTNGTSPLAVALTEKLLAHGDLVAAGIPPDAVPFLSSDRDVIGETPDVRGGERYFEDFLRLRRSLVGEGREEAGRRFLVVGEAGGRCASPLSFQSEDPQLDGVSWRCL